MPAGGEVTFRFTSDDGFFLADVLVDGASIDLRNTNTFTLITSDHTILAMFEPITAQIAVDDTLTVAADSRNNRLDVLANDARQYDTPVPGMALWLDAETLLADHADGAPISQWPDLSGKIFAGQPNLAYQGNSAQQPLLVTNAINSKPAVQFDGIDDYVYWYGWGIVRCRPDRAGVQPVRGGPPDPCSPD